jgi:prepilin-type N-terminal cleavage/methylation domain-containing protein
MIENLFFRKGNKIHTSMIDQRGFTLAEIVVVTAIFTIILGAVGLLARDIFYYNGVFSSGLASYDDARKILRPIASEIRSAAQSSSGSYNIESANSTTFVFFSDVNADGLKERVRYFLSGTTLKRGIIIPTGSPYQYLSANETIIDVVSNVRNGSTAIFTYYDSNYDGTTAALTLPISIASVRLVKITLIIDADPNKPPLPITVMTQVSIRNLKDNL